MSCCKVTIIIKETEVDREVEKSGRDSSGFPHESRTIRSRLPKTKLTTANQESAARVLANLLLQGKTKEALYLIREKNVDNLLHLVGDTIGTDCKYLLYSKSALLSINIPLVNSSPQIHCTSKQQQNHLQYMPLCLKPLMPLQLR